MPKRKKQKNKPILTTRNSILIGGTFLILLIIFFGIRNDIKQRASYTFSNTATWGENLLEEIDSYKKTEPEVFTYKIPDFPENTSKETKKELKYLMQLKEQRTQEKITQINEEIFVYGMMFNEQPLTDYFNPQRYGFGPEFEEHFWEVSTLVLIEKKKFDRVRPHILEPKLQPIIAVPEHPAYPSGHATQVYFAAAYLSEKFPDLKEQFYNDAYRIAHNREIAGVHYPSDSEAGKLLAEQYFEQIQ